MIIIRGAGEKLRCLNSEELQPDCHPQIDSYGNNGS
jgi:hypothetical protein